MSTVVETMYGAVRGKSHSGTGVRIFRGIPYAAPPTADLRWRPPEPPAPWTGVRDASEYGPIAIQNPPASTSLFADGGQPQSEDCLHLNVWAPLDTGTRARPVMVWFHLGAYQFGSGSSPLFDGRRWAQEGVVLVTLNHRLSRTGFLAHPDLANEGAGTAGNYGLHDQLAALRWVRDNIAGFGGDPGCVTICGVSSGASSVALLMAAPAARGLFHRAIAESGGAFGPVAATTGVGDAWQDLESAVESGGAWSSAVGAPRLAELRRMSAQALRAASRPHPRATTGIFDAARPIIDGKLLTAAPHAVFTGGAQVPVPLLVGSAADEDLAVFNYPRDLATFRTQAKAEHGAASDAFLDLYPAETDEQAVAAGLRSTGHRLFTWQNWRWATLHNRAGHPVYYYRFAQPPPVPPGRYHEQRLPRPLGAFHGASLFSTFGGAADPADWNWTARDVRWGATIRSAWVHFAQHGRPTAPGLPAWPEFDTAHPSAMILRADGCVLDDVPERTHLAYWDQWYDRRLKTPTPAPARPRGNVQG
ncbi:carboxylesterase family protein [Amycolatopsis rhizosphaerae]|uniref:Carboxylic ester hydrolase n=1 Tax=Amycolatopsis rhizosphaerae TaxID=2053003 RepID=A0A558D6R6_9PSEU|nr:carboxylesterase family protein [Amycolatopsis rhizosphaerae]TVT56709.1 carboxylesterase family protein [Amycolatopsis rhizosphaerae]